jgi:hypothetical protein
MRFDIPEELYDCDCHGIFIPTAEFARWLNGLKIDYRLSGRFEMEPNNAYGYGYIAATINIEDPNQAMLFKLTWL